MGIEQQLFEIFLAPLRLILTQSQDVRLKMDIKEKDGKTST